ncbi:DnaJ-domain-containing protein [Tilletiaria anomala UBC 951]|uniref:DnaJ-domain-containing protein n=1 Tax=Tilletiaria anomala (strain ATCC 24038 / CBS 436.72 / UBC 951) TaxID=1037660 RepID=A0A066WR94_TILAU|nr:DnaJ-domain-containing protein [Tilletiaria anomala UBC 951]KDN53524.1 DnaJ-domain-containing protein [Tilletiaria anomala UBC 951]
MAAVLDLPFSLSEAPTGFKTSAAPQAISKPTTSTLFAAGPSYLGHVRRQLNQLSFEQDDDAEKKRLEAELQANGADEENVDLPDEEEDEDLLARDPKEWKSQDHYAVLGLSSLRYKASPEQIKLAHRRKVLKHHPDKKAGSSGLANDDSFFKCIAKAHEVLANPERRRQFDSVDEAIDDEAVPTGKEKPENFYKLWAPVFAREARFSEPKNGPIPSLGDEDSTKQQVDEFYSFWYNFDSWRSFEYLDKEINEGSEARDDKRYTEKKNKSERARRKKEDNVRLRNLVDKALSVDPRIKKFKAEEKAAREAKRNKGKPGQANGGLTPAQLAEQKKQKEEEEKKAKEEAVKKEEADKLARADAKKAKEAAKKNLKKEKKRLRDIITSNNYFQAAGAAPSASVIEAQLNGLDAICGALEPEEVVALREACEKAGSADGAKNELNKAAESKSIAAGAFA